MSHTDTSETGVRAEPDAPLDERTGNAAPTVPDETLRHAAQLMLARGTRLAWTHDGHALTLRAGVGQGHAAGLACACLEHDATRLRVAIEHESGTPTTVDGHWRDVDDEARALAWTLANQALLDTLGELFANPVLVSGFEPRGGHGHLWLALDFVSREGQHLEGWLGIGETEARRLGNHDAWENAPGHLPLLTDAEAVDLELWLPGPLLTGTDRAALAAGDVLLLDTAGGPLAELRPAPGATDLVLGLPDRWTLRHAAGDWTVAERDLLQARDEHGRVRVRLTGLHMKLEHLACLAPDTVLAHEPLLPGRTVQITLDDRHCAEGTLVMLGERLGVYIVQLEGEHGFQ